MKVLGAGIDPPHMPVGPPVDDTHPAMTGMAEDHDRRAGDIELDHGVGDRQASQARDLLGHHRRAPADQFLFGVRFRRGAEDVALSGAVGGAVVVAVAVSILQPLLVAAQALLDFSTATSAQALGSCALPCA